MNCDSRDALDLTEFVPLTDLTHETNKMQGMDVQDYDSTSNQLNGKGDKVKGDQRKNKGKWRKVLFDFSQESSFHGIAYISAPTPFLIRRFIWLGIVLTGIGLFIHQMVQSILYYYSYPVTVNVKINYNTTLTFPAVTICNQNDFRATATAGHGQYNLVRDYFMGLQTGVHVDLDSYNMTNMTLDTLYYNAAHRLEDVLVGCQWDEAECSANDFVVQLTDYGVCYTFNNARPGHKVRTVSRTGAQRGLQLRLNIEQYEYMLGPNPGAGVKLLVHDNTEIPLVRDLGNAVPPGAIAFIGVQMLEVKNLRPPHGKCNDTAKLDNYKYYSVPACLVECKAKQMEKMCGCRDVYMQTDANGNPPVCTLEEYQDCPLVSKHASDHEHDDVEELSLNLDELVNATIADCDCPIPCRRVLFDTSITYAESSKFDSIHYLRSKEAQQLQQKLIKALETNQRTDVFTVQRDKELFHSFELLLRELEAVMDDSIPRAFGAVEQLYVAMETLRRRSHFHRTYGLYNINYVMKHNFIRGYNVMDERTFSLLCMLYQEFAAEIRRTFERSNDNQKLFQEMRVTMYNLLDSNLFQRMTLAKRAYDDLCNVYEAYDKGITLLNYKSTTPRYDLDYITMEVVDSSRYNRVKYLTYYKLRIEENLADIQSFQNLTLNVLDGNKVDESMLHDTLDHYEYTCRSVLYYKYLMESRVLNAPAEYSQNLLDIFDELVQKNEEAYKVLSDSIAKVESIIGEFRETWFYMHNIQLKLQEYLKDERLMKQPLAIEIASDLFQTTVKTVAHFFDDVRSQTSTIQSSVDDVIITVKDIYLNIKNTTSLYPFYQHVYEDIINAQQNESFWDEIGTLFSKMLDTDIEWLRDNLDLVMIYTNADLLNRSSSVIAQDVNREFDIFKEMLDVGNAFSPYEASFALITNQLTEEMDAFIESYEMNQEFIMDNFINIDVFMKELSYEEIEQQSAYSLTNLWSDIGGSIGLFIGASIISFMEIIDIFIHNFAIFNCLSSSQTKYVK